MSDEALLYPFQKLYDDARWIEERGELLMRASLRCTHPDDAADGAQLHELALKCFREGRRIRDSIPVPGRV